MSDRSGRISAVTPIADPDAVGPRTPPRVADEVDLAPYLAILWRYRFVIVAATLVFGGVTLFSALAGRRLYEANAVLSVSASKIADVGPGAVGTANFRPIVANRTVAQRVVKQLHLDAPPYAYSGTSFLEEAVQLDEIRNTALLRLAVRLPDPQLATDAANALANEAVQYAQALSQDEAIRARDLIKLQLDLASARLKQTGLALSTFKRTAQLDLARADMESILDQRRLLLGLLVDIEAKKASVAAGQRELERRSKLVTTSKSIDQDPAMLEAARSRTPAGGSPLTLQMKSESVSDTYQDLDKDLARDRVELAQLEQRKQQLIDTRHLNGSEVAKIREFHDKETEQNRLTMEYGIAQKTYEEISAKYEGARLQVAGRSAELQVIDPAVKPTHPLSRQVVSRTVTSAAVGFGVAALCALAFGLARTSRLSPR